jgi:C-terminal processing protease CtpA/Prc
LYTIGCVHTAIKKNTLQAENRLFFPFSIATINGRLYINRSSKHNLDGIELIKINGKPAHELLNDLQHYRGSDGGGNAFAQMFFQKVSSVLIALYFDYPASYQIQTNKGLIEVEATKDVVISEPLKYTGNVTYQNNSNLFYMHNQVAVLRVTSFSKSDKEALLTPSMKYMQNNPVQNLVVDLRGNTGGDRSAAVLLTKYLVDTMFSYSILQPKLTTYRYVNGKGKLFLLLSKLKYNIGAFYRGHKTSLGREFVYKYKPADAGFKGKVFVITDGFTASAATMVTSWLKQYSNATFVGTQAGGGFNGNNGGAFPLLTMPRSKVIITFPAYRVVLASASTNSSGIIPDLQLAYSIEDIATGKDIEMNFIFSLLQSNE